VNVRNRSYAISADVTIDSAGASGVLFAHGCRFGGHALYIKDGKLKYDYNYVGEFDQYVESSKPVPAGDCRLSASFEKSGTGMPTEGLLSLYINQEKVGEGKIKTQPGKFSLAGEGLNVGMDRASRSPATTPAARRGRSPAGRSTRSSSTSPVTRGSTAKRRSRPRSHATDNQEPVPAGGAHPPQEPGSDQMRASVWASSAVAVMSRTWDDRRKLIRLSGPVFPSRGGRAGAVLGHAGQPRVCVAGLAPCLCVGPPRSIRLGCRVAAGMRRRRPRRCCGNDRRR
jgi:hypothetical protein